MKLHEIRSIVRFTQKYKSSDKLPLDLIRLASEQSKLGDFYRILKKTGIETDEEAAFELYGEDHPGMKYKFLKSHFTSRLLGTIGAFDLAKHGISEHTRAIYTAYRNVFQSTVLLRLGNRRAAITLAKKTLLLTEKYELHLVGIELLSHLRSQSLQDGNMKQYGRYSARLEKKIKVLACETKIKEIENKVRIRFSKTLFADDKYYKEAGKALKKIRPLLRIHPTYAGQISCFRLQYTSCQLEGHPSKSIAACDAAIAYMKTKPLMTPKEGIGEFSLYKLENYLLLRDFENGKKMVAICAGYFPEGAGNWFKYKEYHFLFEMHQSRFEEASSLYHEVTAHKDFKQIADRLQQRWKIFGLYVGYVLHHEAPDAGGEKKKNMNFPEVSYYTRDKQGFHVAIILLKILRLLETKDLEGLHKQLEILSSYRFKYLSGKYSRQSFLLFRLLHVMQSSSFDHPAMQKKALMFERKLRRSVPKPAEILECVQVMPPEWMWKMMRVALGGQSLVVSGRKSMVNSRWLGNKKSEK